MKKILILAVVLMLSASTVFAQAGSVGLFADPGGTDCNVIDATSGLLTISAVHVGTAAASAVQFQATLPACFTGTWLSDTAQYPVTIGDSQNGVAIGYGVCLSSPIYALAINVFASGTTPACCYWGVTPDPSVPSGEIEMVDCNDNLFFATGGEAIINPDASCQCNVPTQDSTWGGIKALYSE